LERIISDVDILEVFNARNVFPSDDQAADVYAKEQRKMVIAVSDAHSRWEVGRSSVELGPFGSPDEFLVALKTATLHKHRSPIVVHTITKFNKFRAKWGKKPKIQTR